MCIRDRGLVFQYPEQQVFEETVFDDIAFGPRNLGYSPEEVERSVEAARQVVGLDKELLSRSPFDLSGGQLRRVAVAGILAMNPEVLVLDEPAAGLDPKGRKEILDNIKKLHESGITVILVSHNMEDVAYFCQRILVLYDGTLIADGAPREVFTKEKLIDSIGLKPPEVTIVMRKLRQRGWSVREDVLTVEEGFEEILRCLGTKGVALI